VDVPARTAVALARVVVGVIAVGIGIVIVIGVVIDIIVSSSSRRSLSRSFVPPFSDGDPSDRSVMAFPGV